MIKSIERLREGRALIIDDHFSEELDVCYGITWMTSIQLAFPVARHYQGKPIFARHMASLYVYQLRMCPETQRRPQWLPKRMVEYWIDSDAPSIRYQVFPDYQRFLSCVKREAMRLL